jgi:ParB family chromosome partitioning protein
MDEVEKIILQIKEEKDIFNKARLIQYLIKEKEIRIKDLSAKLGIKSSYLCHLLRLNKLPSLILDGYYSKLVSISHLLVLSRISDEKMIVKIYEKILSDNLTVAQTEEKVREVLHQIKDTGKYLSKEKVKLLVTKIKKDFPHAKIKLIQTRIKGKLVFEIKDNLKNSSLFLEKIIDKLTQ